MSKSIAIDPFQWRTDPYLSRCSNNAKGVFVELLVLAYFCHRAGKITTNDIPWTFCEIAQHFSGNYSENIDGLEELQTLGLLHFNDGLYSVDFLPFDNRKPNPKDLPFLPGLTPPDSGLPSAVCPLPAKAKHRFRDSPYYDIGALQQALLDWPPKLVEQYWNELNDASEANQNLLYHNWAAAARQWLRRAQQKKKH